jgi:hypothetical protein
MSAVVQQHAVGLTWSEPGGMARTAHALADDGRVWLIDPFDDQAALEATASLGRTAGVLQLLDRHNRDCKTIAARLDVPLMRLPDRAPDTPFEIIRVINRPGWREVALWWGEPRARPRAELLDDLGAVLSSDSASGMIDAGLCGQGSRSGGSANTGSETA